VASLLEGVNFRMNNIFLSLITFFGAVFVGGCVNMGIITFAGRLIPAPSGVNQADVNSIVENMHLYDPIHSLAPILAHAVGTLMRDRIQWHVSLLSINLCLLYSLGLFLLGGIMMVMMFPYRHVV